MKLCLILILATVIFPAALGIPSWGAFYNSVKSSVVEKGHQFENSAKNTYKSASDHIQSAYQEAKKTVIATKDTIKETFQKIDNSITEEGHKIYSDVMQTIQSVKSHVSEGLHKLHDIAHNLSQGYDSIYVKIQTQMKLTKDKLDHIGKTMQNYKNGKALFNKIKRYITQTQQLLSSTLESIKEKVDAPAQNTLHTVLNETSGLQAWADEKLVNLKDDDRQNKEEQIKEFVEGEVDKMNECVNETIQPVNDFFKEANETLTNACQDAWQVLDDLDKCIHSNEKVLEKLPKCIVKLTESSKTLVNFVKKDVAGIKDKLQEITGDAKEKLKFKCMRDILADIDKKKEDFEQKLEHGGSTEKPEDSEEEDTEPYVGDESTKHDVDDDEN